jgi:hypothetical protein
VLLFARHEELAVGGDDITGAEPVDGEAELAHQVTEASAQGQATNAGVADDPAGGCHPERLALPVEMGVQATALEMNRSSQWIDPRSGHGGEVDDDPAVAEGMAGHGVPAAPHRRRQIMLPAKAHRGNHIRHTLAPGDQGRPPLHVPVPDLASGVEARVLRLDQLAGEVCRQRLEVYAVDRHHWAPPRMSQHGS